MKHLAALLLLLTAACAHREREITIGVIEDECHAGIRPFEETWPCVRTGFSGPSAYPDIKATYIATGDYVVQQVRDGKVSDVEAKLVMAQARQRAFEAVVARDNATASAAAVVPPFRAVGWTPAPQPSNPMPIPRTVICQTMGTTVICN